MGFATIHLQVLPERRCFFGPQTGQTLHLHLACKEFGLHPSSDHILYRRSFNELSRRLLS